MKLKYFIVFFLLSCAAKRTVKISDDKSAVKSASQSAAEATGTFDLSSVGRGAPKDSGILKFLSTSGEGVGIKQIRWRKPLSTNNPGVDCVLNKSGQDATGTFFHCEYEKWKNKVKIDIYEQIRENRRELVKIQIWVDEKSSFIRWSSELMSMGFRERPTSNKKSKLFYFQNTQALLKFRNSDQSTILELSPIQL